MQDDLDELLVFAEQLAAAAGAVMRDYFARADKSVEQKADKTLVTVADKLINQQVIDAVREHYPTHGVLGEEGSDHPEYAKLWVCDPIDGTDGFIIGVPTAMFSLAFVVDGQPQVAVVYDPFLDRLYTAVQGHGAYVNGQRIQVSPQPRLNGSRLGSSASADQIIAGTALFNELISAGAKVKGVPGLVCRGVLVASGKIDGCIALGAAHDFAAVKLLVEEAGGTVTDVEGHAQRYDGPVRGIIFSNGKFHDSLVAAVGRYGADKFLVRQR